jgi:N-carbamoylputrescine amidase
VIDGKRGYLGKYRKMHIPDDPRYFEKFYFTPGDLGFRSFSTAGGTLGVLVCWDQWYPEAARLTALQGAEILFYPTAIGWHPEEKERFGERQHTAWELSQRAHAVANGCYVVAVNRTGFEPTPGKKDQEPSPGGIEFWGQSFVAAPDGSILARAPIAEEAMMVVPVELAQLETTRIHWPFLRDRRIDAYGGITARYIDKE